MDNSLSQNWEKFLSIQAVGDWNGVWTQVGIDEQSIERYHGVRSYFIYPDREAVVQKNHYRYEDGTSESRSFGPYRNGELKTPFLDYSWTWGYTPKIEPRQLYFSETCIKHERTGISSICKYLEDGSLHQVFSIWETLDAFKGMPEIQYSDGIWKVTEASTITPELTITRTSDLKWKPIDELAKDNLIVPFSNGVTVSLPLNVADKRELLIATDWIINERLIKRGIRYYNMEGEFSHFSIISFVNEK